MNDIVYKYHTSSVVLEHILGAGTVRFTPPWELNDPFECGPDPGAAFTEAVADESRKLAEIVKGPGLDPELAIELLTEKCLRVSFQNAFGQVAGVLSLSQRADSAVMWSHYSQNHAGFAVGFDAHHEFFQPGGGISRDGLRVVQYPDQRPAVPLQLLNGPANATLLDMREVTDAFFFTKSPHWQYEEEVRVIRSRDEVTESRVAGVVKYPADLVREIIVGARTSKEDLAMAYDLQQTKYPQAQMMVAVLDTRRYAMRIEPAPPKLFMQLLRTKGNSL